MPRTYRDDPKNQAILATSPWFGPVPSAAAMTDPASTLPTFTAYFNPVLDALRSIGGVASNAQIEARVASDLALADEQLALPHKVGVPGQTEHAYRIAWARTYLKKVGLLENPQRSFWRLTAAGASAGAIDPATIAARVRADWLAGNSEAEMEAEAEADADSSVAGPTTGIHLDARLGEELPRLHTQMLATGRLLQDDVLAACYHRFADRFGPSILRSLDGEKLLLTMHARGTKDSLVYWLEFKADDELPGCFGSIAGGSALKFGLYQSADDGRWWTGSTQQQVLLTTAAAIALARRQRDQLVAAADLLGNARTDPASVDYDELQRRIQLVAPDVGETAWAHKYLALLFPTVLDDYHVAVYQQFHLIKLLQQPQSGRYANAGPFLAIARELGIPVTHLGTLLNQRDGNPHAYWRVGTTVDDTSEWERMRSGGFMAIGWSELGDLSSLEPDQPSRSRLRDMMAPFYPDNAGTLTRKTQEVFSFVTRAAERDLVLAMDGMTVVGIGRVSGRYFFREGDGPFAHRRPVEWIDTTRWRLPETEGLLTTFIRLGKRTANLIELERRLLLPRPLVVNPPTGESGSTRSPPRALTGVPARADAILERKGQVILYGPPGTGKTHWARTAIDEIVARRWFNTAHSQLTEADHQVLRAAAAVATCTFHPAYGYEDFIEGYRPEQSGSGPFGFKLRAGIFKALCERAAADKSQRPYFLLIDEINRGDIPRIFGELLTLLELDKRGSTVHLPVSGELFLVPRNVFVVATMNTADRSIALLDAALRRRFGFVELMPDSTALLQTSIDGLPLGKWLDELNRRIVQHVSRNARNLQVGHAYLLDRGQPIATAARLAQVLREDLIPLLEEYCYEDFLALEAILGPTIILKGQQRVDDSLFTPERHADLIDALLKAFPGITASPAAVTAAGRASELDADETAAAEP